MAKYLSEEKYRPSIGEQAGAPIIHEAITVSPDPYELMPIEVNSAFPAGAKSILSPEEQAKVDALIEAVPDKNDPLVINYWVDMEDKKVYLEGWCDECLAGTGFPPMGTFGEWDDKIQHMIRATGRTLVEKQEERDRPYIGPGHWPLIEGGFREFEAGDRENLYGVTWGVYTKAKNPTVPEVTPGFYVLKPISVEAKDWVTILSEDYKRTPEGNILVRPSDMEQIGKLIREDYLDITKDFTVARPRTAGNPDAKEPWQMTRAEHLEAARTWRQEYMPRLKGQALEDELRKVDEGHRRTVEYALAKGKPVPPEVLAEYPDLEARYGPEEIHLGEKMIVVPIEKPIIDLRGDYDEIAHVKDGILYRKGNINQVWWDKWGKETWTAPDERQARENFDAMKERWSPSFHPQTTPDEVEPKRYIIKQEPEPLYKSGKKYVAYYEDGTPRYLAAETEQELKTRLLEAEPSAEFVNPPIAEVPEAKEPWQMTKAEYRASQYKAMRDTTINQMSAKSLMEGGEKAIEEGTQWRLDMLAGAHKSYIRKMLAEGKPVPPEVLAEYPDLARKANPPAVEAAPIPKTYVTRLGFTVEMPVARAVDVLADYEIPVSSGFHGALNDRWTIVFQDSISPKLRRLAEELGFEVGTRPVRGTTRSYIYVSLPSVSVDELGMATDAFDRLAEGYIGKARFLDRYGFNVGQKISGQSPIDNPIKEKLGLESNPPFERLGEGEIANKLLPMPPGSGPPLPRILGLKWPWKE